MNKGFFAVTLMLFSTLQAQAFEEYILSTKSILSEIKIENQEILNIEPIVTIDNSKNTLFIIPLKEGETSFSFVKDKKEKISFDVKIEGKKAFFSKIEGFDIVAFDEPPIILDCNLDKPPVIKKDQQANNINIDGAIVDTKTLDNEEGK